MEEFIFGTFATDHLKLVNHRASHYGIQHAYRISPRDPRPGEPITLIVELHQDVNVDHVACYYTLDGTEPSGARGVAAHGVALPFQQVCSEWDSLVWGYRTRWEVTLPPQPAGTIIHYRIGAWQGDQPEIFADWPLVKTTVEDAAYAFFHSKPAVDFEPIGDPQAGHLFNLYIDELSPPEWAREAVIYQIFVDRFYPGDGRTWLQTDDLRAFCGGTLQGVAHKMDYIAELGATCIWLSPISPSPSHHGYDVTDYYRVEPRLGGEEGVRAVVEAAHARGIRVILDLVVNHTSDLHPAFKEALSDPHSPKRDWFFFNEREPNGYRSFFGVKSMPQVNVDHPEARAWMLDIARYWLQEFDVDGYRLDHAAGPGPGFWSEFWAQCKAVKPDCFIFGEIVEPPEIMLQYIGRMDGVLDFHLADAFRRSFGRQHWTEVQFDTFVKRHLAFFPRDFLLPSFLDNHDMDRFLFVAGDNKDRLRQAAEIQFRLPGPPVIYYGTEIGLSQLTSRESAVGLEASRVPMLWDGTQDRELLAFYQRLIRERRTLHPWDQAFIGANLCM